MLVLQQHQPKRNRPGHKRRHHRQPIHPPLHPLLHPRQRLARRDAGIRSTRHGDHHTHRLVARISRRHDDPSQGHAQSRKEIDDAGLEEGETGVFDEEEEIGEFLGEFVEDGDEEDGEEGGSRALEEGGGDEDSVGEVAEEVAGDDGEDEGFVEEGFGLEGCWDDGGVGVRGTVSRSVRRGLRLLVFFILVRDGNGGDGNSHVSIASDIRIVWGTGLARGAFLFVAGEETLGIVVLSARQLVVVVAVFQLVQAIVMTTVRMRKD
mmetsp:Transcript_27974/g.59825  ORF Transcript_27974/g.59825 Transcript_27974/m.59825 type:complete len:264 (-) Transcript_27974:1147-1938(-)